MTNLTALFWRTVCIQTAVFGFAFFGAVQTVAEFFEVTGSFYLDVKLGIVAVATMGFLVFKILARINFFKSLTSFFALADDRRINIVIASYEHIIPYDPEKKHLQKRYRKRTASGDYKEIDGAHDYVCGLSSVSCVVNTIEAVPRLPEVTLSLRTDEEVVRDLRENRIKNQTFISFGSPSSSSLAEWLYARKPLLDQSDLFHFVGTDKLVPNRVPPAGGFESTKTTDYAVLARLTKDTNTFFICAGIDEEGTVAAVQELFVNWKEMSRNTHNRDFFQIYLVDKETKQMEPHTLRLEKNSTEEYYKKT